MDVPVPPVPDAPVPDAPVPVAPPVPLAPLAPLAPPVPYPPHALALDPSAVAKTYIAQVMKFYTATDTYPPITARNALPFGQWFATILEVRQYTGSNVADRDGMFAMLEALPTHHTPWKQMYRCARAAVVASSAAGGGGAESVEYFFGVDVGTWLADQAKSFWELNAIQRSDLTILPGWRLLAARVGAPARPGTTIVVANPVSLERARHGVPAWPIERVYVSGLVSWAENAAREDAGIEQEIEEVLTAERLAASVRANAGAADDVDGVAGVDIVDDTADTADTADIVWADDGARGPAPPRRRKCRTHRASPQPKRAAPASPAAPAGVDELMAQWSAIYPAARASECPDWELSVGTFEWFQGMRQHRHAIPPDAAERLSEMPRWTWERSSAKWFRRLCELRQYMDTHGGTLPRLFSKAYQYHELSRWVWTQHMNQLKLHPEKRAALESLPGWTWS